MGEEDACGIEAGGGIGGGAEGRVGGFEVEVEEGRWVHFAQIRGRREWTPGASLLEVGKELCRLGLFLAVAVAVSLELRGRSESFVWFGIFARVACPPDGSGGLFTWRGHGAG